MPYCFISFRLHTRWFILQIYTCITRARARDDWYYKSILVLQEQEQVQPTHNNTNNINLFLYGDYSHQMMKCTLPKWQQFPSKPLNIAWASMSLMFLLIASNVQSCQAPCTYCKRLVIFSNSMHQYLFWVICNPFKLHAPILSDF